MLGESAPRLATALSIALLFGAIYGFVARCFSGRAAFIETGVLIGAIMTGNVWFAIVPSQHALVDATTRRQGAGPEAVDPGEAARSIHNNYLTFPLIFIMVSNHFSASDARTR